MSLLTTDKIIEIFCIVDDFSKELAKELAKMPHEPDGCYWRILLFRQKVLNQLIFPVHIQIDTEVTFTSGFVPCVLSGYFSHNIRKVAMGK
jgi:hypothetical protein